VDNEGTKNVILSEISAGKRGHGTFLFSSFISNSPSFKGLQNIQ